MNGRRNFLKTASLLTMTGLAGCAKNVGQNQAKKHENATEKVLNSHCLADLRYEFFGKHQSGITTPVQRHVYFLVADLHSKNVDEIRQMFKDWTDYSVKLMNGENIKPYGNNPHLPPADTGETDSLGAYGLTLTFGISPTFLKKLNLEHKAPPEFSELPKFPRDQIKDELSGGDICIQACSEDPQVAFHAVRQLVRQARSLITMKWSQAGFNSFDSGHQTPRNLFAFKDGTANKTTMQNPDKWLWIDNGVFQNGSYLVVRLIQMHLETWDRTSLVGQDDTFGRHRASGASIGKTDEFDALDIHAKDDKGNLIVGEVSHAGLANRTGLQMLRRSYSYSSGIVRGQFDAGLLFISFQKNPMQFSAIQSAFGNKDKMTEYTTHIGSGLFACFGGVTQGEYLGQSLFE
ncbi:MULTISPECIES: Dyp-type peroxidase [unclassified Moraxella]|uniref:Dyp-type peroxidase n=1 Tax=unclassified Moraxella TaxID=2685852 RepID=UPI002B410B48|nr:MULTISPECIES: Dyp-type peroxidase [unclassified Moraxella]